MRVRKAKLAPCSSASASNAFHEVSGAQARRGFWGFLAPVQNKHRKIQGFFGVGPMPSQLLHGICLMIILNLCSNIYHWSNLIPPGQKSGLHKAMWIYNSLVAASYQWLWSQVLGVSKVKWFLVEFLAVPLELTTVRSRKVTTVPSRPFSLVENPNLFPSLLVGHESKSEFAQSMCWGQVHRLPGPQFTWPKCSPAGVSPRFQFAENVRPPRRRPAFFADSNSTCRLVHNSAGMALTPKYQKA